MAASTSLVGRGVAQNQAVQAGDQGLQSFAQVGTAASAEPHGNDRHVGPDRGCPPQRLAHRPGLADHLEPGVAFADLGHQEEDHLADTKKAAKGKSAKKGKGKKK